MKYTIKEVRGTLGEPDGGRLDRLEVSTEGNRKPMLKVKIKKKEKLKGGAGDNKPDSSFDPKQLKIGIGDETGEHTPNKQIGKEIAKDHLSQDPDYYKKLKAAGLEEAHLDNQLFKKYHNSLLKRGWDTSDAEEIGSGYNGIAFKFGGDKVLKITTDETEVRAASQLKGKNLRHVIKIYDTFTFAKQNDYESWYGIVAEYAEPLQNKELLGNYIYFISSKVNLSGEHVDSPWELNWGVLKKRVIQNCFDDKEDIIYANEAFSALEKLQFPDLFAELKQNNIVYRDVQEDNFRMKDNVLVLVDLGGNTKSSGTVPPRLKEKIIKESTEQQKSIIAWKNSRWMFVDTETTGLPPDKKNPGRKDPRVVQVGYVVVDNMKIVKVFNDLVDPGEEIEIDPSASAITGIDRKRLKAAGARNFTAIIEGIKRDMESCQVIMAYNKQFDKPVLEREFKIANVEMPNKPWLDPMIWVMKHLPLPNHRLTTIADHFKVSLERAHDAGADAEASALVTMAFVQTFDGLPDDAEEVVRLQGEWERELKAARIATAKKRQQIKEQEKVKNFYVLVGPPAVGKSTWIKKNFVDKNKNFQVISNDEIIEKIIYPKYGLTAREIWSKDPNKPQEAKEAFKEVQKLIADRIKEVIALKPENIIIDGLNATKNSRAQSLRIAKMLPEYKIIAVKFEFAGHEEKVLQADIARAKERSGERIAMNPDDIKAKMASITADPPTTAEGFDEVISYNRFTEPLNEAKLSTYWKKRAARRAKNASRNWPNGIDRQWAITQQEKSQSINNSVQNIFQKELDETEALLDDVSGMMQKMKKTRDDIRMRREAKQSFDHPAKATLKRKKGKTLSVKTKSEYGGVKKGFDKKRKKLKGPVIAPGESFGPIEE